MARLTGALFSLAASGTIADTLTFAKWKGIQYVRTRVIPANPQSAAQTLVRDTFRTLNDLWKRMPTLGRESYAANADGQPYTDRNKHIKESLVALRDGLFFQDYEWSIAGGQAIPPLAFVTSGGAGIIDATTMTIPTAPVGHTLYSRVCGAILHGTPSDGIVRTMYCGERLGAAGVPRIDAVPAGVYNTGGWLKWTRDSDGQIFYSSFLTYSATVT